MRTALLLLLTLPLAACGSLTEPDPPVPDSTVVDVLTDLHLLDARSGEMGDVPPGTREALLAAHGLDSTRFDRALLFYADHPERYFAVYDSVVSRLSEERARR